MNKRTIEHFGCAARLGVRLIVVVAASLVFAAPAGAATLTVDDAGDDLDNMDGAGCRPGVTLPCQLRGAVNLANVNGEADMIRFDSSGTVTLLNGPLTIAADRGSPLAIVGQGAQNLTVSGNRAGRVFDLAAGANVSLAELRISQGRASDPAGDGGGIRAQDAALALVGVVLDGNSAASGGGGVFQNGGSIVMRNSTIAANSAKTGGGITTAGNANLSAANSTISDNAASDSGGGADLVGGGNLQLNSATVASNSATVDSNISLNGPLGPASSVANTIVADPRGGGLNCDADLSSGGHNLEATGVTPPASGSSCGFQAATDQIVTDAVLEALALNGGRTPTRALQSASPALDKGQTPIDEDQREVDRPQGVADDIGAFELERSGLGVEDPIFCRGRAATIVGTPGDDDLRGTPGDDVIAALDGNDTVEAGRGDDLICGGSSSDRVNGNGGDDEVAGGDGDDELRGGAQNDSLSGNSGDDELNGNRGKDMLRGGPGSQDRCAGGQGEDRTVGGCDSSPERGS